MRGTAMNTRSFMALGLLAVSLFGGEAGAAAVPTPTNFQATVTPGASSSSVTLNWSADGAPTSFTLQKINFTTGLVTYTVVGNARSTVQAGLAKGNIYHYRIRANTAAGVSEYTPVLDVVVP